MSVAQITFVYKVYIHLSHIALHVIYFYIMTIYCFPSKFIEVNINHIIQSVYHRIIIISESRYINYEKQKFTWFYYLKVCFNRPKRSPAIWFTQKDTDGVDVRSWSIFPKLGSLTQLPVVTCWSLHILDLFLLNIDLQVNFDSFCADALYLLLEMLLSARVG